MKERRWWYTAVESNTPAVQENGRHGCSKGAATHAWARLSDGNGDTHVSVNEHCLE